MSGFKSPSSPYSIFRQALPHKKTLFLVQKINFENLRLHPRITHIYKFLVLIMQNIINLGLGAANMKKHGIENMCGNILWLCDKVSILKPLNCFIVQRL